MPAPSLAIGQGPFLAELVRRVLHSQSPVAARARGHWCVCQPPPLVAVSPPQTLGEPGLPGTRPEAGVASVSCTFFRRTSDLHASGMAAAASSAHELGKELSEAAFQGDVSRVKQLLDIGAHIDRRNTVSLSQRLTLPAARPWGVQIGQSRGVMRCIAGPLLPRSLLSSMAARRSFLVLSKATTSWSVCA